MRLRSLGSLQLEGCDSHKLSPQILLLVCYVSLEGPASRTHLARLFWGHLEGEMSKKGERKDLNNVAVALATLKREAGLDLQAIESLAHDTKTFLADFEDKQYTKALSHYATFLEGLEDKPRLTLGSELYSWMMGQREALAHQARQACLALAAEAIAREDFAPAQHILRQAFERDKAWLNPATLSRLYQLMVQAGSDLLSQVRQCFESWLEDARSEGLLSASGLKLFLVLALQREPHLAIAQMAVDLSPRGAMLCIEELIACRLLGAQHKVLARDLAMHHLEQHPSEHMNLLLALRDHTPTQAAYPIYQQLYALSKTFGGMGYWQAAREAYTTEARAYIQADDFQMAMTILRELAEAEAASQQSPEAEPRFMQAYALERLGHINEGLAVLRDAPKTYDCEAVRASLLMKAGDFEEASRIALAVSDQQARSTTTSWARAIAVNTLGQLAFQKNCPREAEAYFADASVQWRLAGVKSRELGAMMNRANAFYVLGMQDKAMREIALILTEAENYPALKIKALLNRGYFQETEQRWEDVCHSYQQALELAWEQQDSALHALILNNLGFATWQVGKDDQATAYFQQSMTLALAVGEQLTYACALGNLAACQQDISLLDAAIRLIEDIGSEHELAQYQRLRADLAASLS